MAFVGTYAHTIDAKQRLAIPAPVRADLQRETGAGEGDAVYLYVTLGEGDSLYLYTERGFEQQAENLRQEGLDPDEILAYERIFFSQAQRLELDKQGRVRLPETLLKEVGLGADVVLLGVNDHLEVRDRSAWEAYLAANRRPGGMDPRRVLARARLGHRGALGGSGGGDLGGSA